MKILKDPYNTEIEEGMKCAFNYAGETRLGRITEIKESRNGKPKIFVKEEMSQWISKVTSPKNLVILPN